jgi:hypothetical protein
MRRYPNHSLSFHVESFVLIVSVVLILICCFVVLLTYTMFALSHFALHLMHDMSVCLSYHILRCFPCAYDVCLTTFCVASLMHTMFALSHFALLPLCIRCLSCSIYSSFIIILSIRNYLDLRYYLY